MEQRYDIVVVGGGHNGLTAAFYFARAGMKTLVLERRDVVGGACVTEEIAPGVKASTTSYIASMLRPEIIEGHAARRARAAHGPCEPALQIALEGGRVLPWWSDDEPHRRGDREVLPQGRPTTFVEVTHRLHRLARHLQGFFLEEPPDLYATGWGKVKEGKRAYTRLKGLGGDELTDLVRFTTGSLGEFVERWFESDEVNASTSPTTSTACTRRRIGPGTAIGLDVPHALGRRARGAGLQRPRDRRHGIDLPSHGRRGAPRSARRSARARRSPRIATRDGRATGVVLDDGTEIVSRAVVSNADPKRTFLGLLEKSDLPEDFRDDVAAIKMAGPCAKVNLSLTRGARVDRHARGRESRTSDRSRRSCRRWKEPSAATTSTNGARSPTSSGSTA